MDVDEIVQEESTEKKTDMTDILRKKKDRKRPALMRRWKGTGCQLILAQ